MLTKNAKSNSIRGILVDKINQFTINRHQDPFFC